MARREQPATEALAVGERVIWRHEMRGGYGYIERVPATIERLAGDRILIAAEKASGETVTRWVWRKSLERRP